MATVAHTCPQADREGARYITVAGLAIVDASGTLTAGEMLDRVTKAAAGASSQTPAAVSAVDDGA